MSDIRDAVRSKAEALRVYAEIGGTEVEEMCIYLIQIAQRTDFLTDEFIVALDKELGDNLNAYKDYSRIVETEETFTRTVKTIEWDN